MSYFCTEIPGEADWIVDAYKALEPNIPHLVAAAPFANFGGGEKRNREAVDDVQVSCSGAILLVRDIHNISKKSHEPELYNFIFVLEYFVAKKKLVLIAINLLLPNFAWYRKSHQFNIETVVRFFAGYGSRLRGTLPATAVC